MTPKELALFLGICDICSGVIKGQLRLTTLEQTYKYSYQKAYCNYFLPCLAVDLYTDQ